MELSPKDSYPISKHIGKILTAIWNNPVTVISGKTGCGKSTQVPKALWQEDKKTNKIAICQPTRVGAQSLAKWVSHKLKRPLGYPVGYHIGMESVKEKDCAIIYMTYGVLIQQLLFSEHLQYTHIILDEIHERSLDMDFCFVALKKLFNKRVEEGKSQIKLVVMSATLDYKAFCDYFAMDPKTDLFFIPEIKMEEQNVIQHVISRQHVRYGPEVIFRQSKMPEQYEAANNFKIEDEHCFNVVESFQHCNLYLFKRYGMIRYQRKPILNTKVLHSGISTMLQIDKKQIKGDTLIFVPGFLQIQKVKGELLQKKINEKRIIEVHSFFSDQIYKKLYQSNVENKIILTTSMGQSSITLPNCKYVIDFCLTKCSTLNQNGISKLETRFASKSSLTQRAGRVGRVSDGFVFRMIRKQDYNELPEYQEPEIKGISLEMVILKAKQLDANNKSSIFDNPYKFLFEFMDPPEKSKIEKAINNLIKQQALDGPSILQKAHKLKLTKTGQFMVLMPCDFYVSKMIMMGIKLRIPGLIVAVASIMMATKEFFQHEDRRQNSEEFMHALIGYDTGLNNDFLLRERIYNHWKQLFYYPQKEQWFERRGRIKKDQNSRKKESEEFFGFLNDFRKSRLSDKEKDFGFPKGINLKAMRQLVWIEEDLRYKLRNMGVVFLNEENYVVSMFQFCLAYAFEENSSSVSFKKRFKKRQDLQYGQKYEERAKKQATKFKFRLPTNLNLKNFYEYFYPQEDFDIKAVDKKQFIEFDGNKSVRKKILFPQQIQLNKKEENMETSTCSDVYKLFQDPRIYNENEFKVEYETNIKHGSQTVVILEESINQLIFPDSEDDKLMMLTNEISMHYKDQKKVKMSSLMRKDIFILCRLLTSKDVKICMHHSGERISHVKIDTEILPLRVFIGREELEDIQNIRQNILLNKENPIYDQKELMKHEDVKILHNLLMMKNVKQKEEEEEEWEQAFCTSIGKKYTPSDERNSRQNSYSYFKDIFYRFKFENLGSFLKKCQEWKKERAARCMKEYLKLRMNQIYLICSKCSYYNPIVLFSKYNQDSSRVLIKDMITWDIFTGRHNNSLKNRMLSGYCVQCINGHEFGRVEDESHVKVYTNKVKVYVPCEKIYSCEKKIDDAQLKKKQLEALENIELARKIELFYCAFCDTTLRPKNTYKNSFVNGKYKTEKMTFWEEIEIHFASHEHKQNQERLLKM